MVDAIMMQGYTRQPLQSMRACEQSSGPMTNGRKSGIMKRYARVSVSREG